MQKLKIDKNEFAIFLAICITNFGTNGLLDWPQVWTGLAYILSGGTHWYGIMHQSDKLKGKKLGNQSEHYFLF